MTKKTEGFSRHCGFYVKAMGAVLLLGSLAGGYIVLARSQRLQQLLSPEAVRALIDGLGPWGPAALVGAMAAAIVFSPVPSAPITLAAGAVYGHTWGTIYAVAGAEIGALVAFGIAARWDDRSWPGCCRTTFSVMLNRTAARNGS